VTEEWMPVYAGGAMKSDPQFHPVLDRYRDLAERERRLGVLPGTPILVDPMRVIDDRLIRFFNSLTWRSQSRGTRDTYKTVYRTFFEWMASQHRDVFSATDEDVGLWKILRTDREVNPTGAVEGATWNKEIAGLNLLFRWASHPARGYMPVNPLAGLPNRGRMNTGRAGG